MEGDPGSRTVLLYRQNAGEVVPLLPSEALSSRDIARLFPVAVSEANARRLLLARVRAGETCFSVCGGPFKVRGTWLATLEWWQGALGLTAATEDHL